MDSPPTELPDIETAQFIINVEHNNKDETATATIECDEDCSLKFWVSACEYLLYQTARRSSAGFERALELLCQGAMNYKDVKET